MKNISISLSDEDYKFIKFVAKDNGRTMAAEIRHALTVYYAPDQTPQIIKPAGRHPRITEDRILSRPSLCA